jgi:hypothetical protein
VTIAARITCPDCGGTAHLVSRLDPDEELEAGDVVTYACEDCWSRWDLVVDDDDLVDEDRADEDPQGGAGRS